MATVPAGDGPHGVDITPDGSHLYVVNNFTNLNVTVIETDTNTITTQIQLNDAAFGVVITPDGSKAYVSKGFGNIVWVIDTATNTVLTTVTGTTKNARKPRLPGVSRSTRSGRCYRAPVTIPFLRSASL